MIEMREIEKKNPLKNKDWNQVYSDMDTTDLEIEKKNPLKQGLKPGKKFLRGEVYENWKEESIKTRIETWSATG